MAFELLVIFILSRIDFSWIDSDYYYNAIAFVESFSKIEESLIKTEPA